MQRVLDIDLDYFLADCCPLAAMGERPMLKGHEPWAAEAVEHFLERQCLLSQAHPIPGRIFPTHDGALLYWRELLEEGRLRAPFHVTHVDAHSDLGIGYPGPGYVLYNVLSLPPENRMDLERFYAQKKLDESNYLLFALAARIIGSLDNVRRPFSKADIPSHILQPREKGEEAFLCLPQSFFELFEKRNGPEPRIPFRHVQQDGAFMASAPYDFVSVAVSPRYAPREADDLLPVFRKYMRPN